MTGINLFSNHTLFAEVILPLPLPNSFTYSIGSFDEVKIGSRVLVQFGKKRIITGIVKDIHQNKPKHYEAKEILELLDDEPLVNTQQLKLIDWVASYYMCTPGEVLNAALPSGIKLSSESKIQLNPDKDTSTQLPIDPREQVILNVIARQNIVSLNELPKLCGISRVLPLVRSLLEKGEILLFEEVKEKYAPKSIKKIRLSSDYYDKKSLQSLFEKLKDRPKQTDIILKILSLNQGSQMEIYEKGVDKKYLREIIESDSSLRTLLKAGVLTEYSEVIPRFPHIDKDPEYQSNLSKEQTTARDQILEHFKITETVLLHGITGSGKTEIYINLIHQAIEGGSQVLYLLPEIALTTQIVNRLKRVFGARMGIYHSRFSDNERVEVYKNLLSGKYSLIVGVRSSIFLPFDNLGLIIVDEEHETSYKQYDPAPRYNARDSALVLARIHSAQTLMGTATPSVEVYYQALHGRWGLVELHSRYSTALLPEIRLVDLKKEKKRKSMKNEFSEILFTEMETALSNQEQIILFQNRRGYSPFLTCEDCAYVFNCKSCDVSLTYHLRNEELKCHYCNHTEVVPRSCPACGSTKVKTAGFGTEKLEDDLKLFIPDAKLARMDQDTTRKKNSYQEIISDFEKNNTHVLIGTQMVTKGLDFDNVSLVGIFDTDRSLYYPDFRAYERTFQLLTQVSGRAGRKNKPGKVIIQTSFPEHKIFKQIIANDYIALFNDEIEERRRFFYPPFSRMIKLTIKNLKPDLAEQCAKSTFEDLLKLLGKERVLGPEVPLINKIRNQFLVNIYIKLERDGVNLGKAKDKIQKIVFDKTTSKTHRSTSIVIDVDPV
jgi:primosomal protein N' (replication factor Y)